METTPQKASTVTVDFRGTGFEMIGYGLRYLILSILIIPAAWGAVPLYRWLAKSLKLSDGTEVSFEGRAIQVWGWFAIGVVVALTPQLARLAEDEMYRVLWAYFAPWMLLPLSALAWLSILRWAVSHVRLSCGTSLAFKGTLAQYLGWAFLVSISVYTIIGWAWATAAMVRWICEKTEGGGHRVRFLGSGGQLLWRGFAVIITSIAVIPIPWMVVWLLKWFAQNIVIEKGVPEIEMKTA